MYVHTYIEECSELRIEVNFYLDLLLIFNKCQTLSVTYAIINKIANATELIM